MSTLSLIFRSLLITVLNSFVFALIVGYMLLHAENINDTRNDAVDLLNRLDHFVQASHRKTMLWSDRRFEDSSAEVEKLLFSLNGRIDPELADCAEELAGLAQLARKETPQEPEAAITAFQMKLDTYRVRLNSWANGEIYYLKYLDRSPRAAAC